MKKSDAVTTRLPSRREFLSLGVGGFVIAATGARLRRRTVVRRTVPVMGTIAELAVLHRDARYAHGALDAAVAQLSDVDTTMSRFLAASDVGRVNRATPGSSVAIRAETAAVLAAALHWAEATDGVFDPCVGRLVALWDVEHRDAPPPLPELRRLAGRRLHRQLELGRRRAEDVVVMHDPDTAIDLGGIAKGHGVDRAVAALRQWGITDGLVNVGGDLYALGVSEDGDAWEVGVRSPEDPRQLAAVFRLSDRAAATSGDYLQYFDHDGRRYHHLLDPRTGEPRRTARHSLTVAASDCMTADAAATALFGSPAPDATRILARVAPAAEVLHQV